MSFGWFRVSIALMIGVWLSTGGSLAANESPPSPMPRIEVAVTIGSKILPGGGYSTLTVPLSPQSFPDRPTWTLTAPEDAAAKPRGTETAPARPQRTPEALSGRVDIFAVADQPDRTILSFPVPDPPKFWPFWQTWHLKVTGPVKPVDDQPSVTKLIYESDVKISARTPLLLLTILTVAIVYPGCVLIAWAARRRADRQRAKLPANVGSPSPTFLETLDPVQLTANANGRASLSKLQVFCFSLLVFAIVLYLQLRLGFLTGLSNDVLTLLGISAGGALAGKVTGVMKDRLQYANWAWLKSRGWLSADKDVKKRARWRELFMDEREFDVYRMQMAIFSIVVAIALVTADPDRLANFEIPQQLLILLGISQGVYVGGKAVTPSSRAELDQQLTEVRRLERVFRDKAFETLKAPAAGQPPWTPAQLQTAAGAEHLAYRDALRLAKEMFDATFSQ